MAGVACNKRIVAVSPESDNPRMAKRQIYDDKGTLLGLRGVARSCTRHPLVPEDGLHESDDGCLEEPIQPALGTVHTRATSGLLEIDRSKVTGMADQVLSVQLVHREEGPRETRLHTPQSGSCGTGEEGL